MKESLAKKLKEAFPRVYTNMTIPGLPGSGWFQLLWDLGEKIEKYLDEAKIENYHTSQVKEKFGELRFYFVGDNKIEEFVSEAYKKSQKTCEHCGKTGKLNTEHSWQVTLCEECVKLRNTSDKALFELDVD